MNERLDEIRTALGRIEGKLDASAEQFAAHVIEDQATARAVAKLASQRGYVLAGLAAIGAGITAAAAYLARITWGNH